MEKIEDVKKSEKYDQFIRECPILFKKFKVEKKIGKGAFGTVYLGKNINNNQPVAIKVEKKTSRPTLESEAYILIAIKDIGFPKLISFGKTKNFRVLIEPLLGESLFDIFIKKKLEFSVEEVCMIALQIIDRIQSLHCNNYIYRDIKPDNFLIGNKDPNVIYIIDFGLCMKYKSSRTKKHYKFGYTNKFFGTTRFASPNALKGGKQSRKDDLICIGYMLIYFMKKRLPWQDIKGNSFGEKFIKTLEIKSKIKPEVLCQELPNQMVEYMEYVHNLGFEEDPNYNYLRGLFKSILKDKNVDIENYIFSWIKESDYKNLKKTVNLRERKSSSRERLLKSISESLEKKLRNKSCESFDKNSYNAKFKVINNPNLKVQRGFGGEDFDSTMDLKNISKSKNNSLYVNFDKTIDNELIEGFKNTDNKCENTNLSNNNKENRENNYILNSGEKNYKIDEPINKKDKFSEIIEKANIIKEKLLSKKNNQFKENYKQGDYNLFDNKKNELNKDITNNKVNGNNFGTNKLINDNIKEMYNKPSNNYNYNYNTNTFQNQKTKNQIQNVFPEDGNNNNQYNYKKISKVTKINKNNREERNNLNNKEHLTIGNNYNNNFYNNNIIKNNINKYNYNIPNIDNNKIKNNLILNKNINSNIKNHNSNENVYSNLEPSDTILNDNNNIHIVQTDTNKNDNILKLFNGINNDLYNNKEVYFGDDEKFGLQEKNFQKNLIFSNKQNQVTVKNSKIIEKIGINKQKTMKKEYQKRIDNSEKHYNNKKNNTNINNNINSLRKQERFQRQTNAIINNNNYPFNNIIPNDNFNYMINNNIQDKNRINYNDNKRAHRFHKINLTGDVSPFGIDFLKEKNNEFY